MSTPDEWYVAALAGFDDMTTARLRALQAGRSPEEAYAIASGAEPPPKSIAAIFTRFHTLRAKWTASASTTTPTQVGERCGHLGVEIVLPGDARFPPQLYDDPRRPAVLFVQGDLGVLDARRVGIVGTRNPTRSGRQTSARFGHELAAAGVVVVSGLALGIDGAAHRGVLAADDGVPVAVVANGHGAPYPKRHAALWGSVVERGAVISEWPPGTAPDAFRFPQRNRILAALCEVVVVVESRERGGSLITAREAAERGIDVFAVPGPIDQRSSAGTNALLEDGAAPATSPETVLAALGLDHRRAGRRRFDTRVPPRGAELHVLELCRRGPQNLASVSVELNVDLTDAAMRLARLEQAGWVAELAGWFEAVDEYADLA